MNANTKMTPEMRRRLHEMMRSTIAQGVVVVVGAGFAVIFGGALLEQSPVFVRAYLPAWLILSVALLAVSDWRLFVTLGLLVKEPWNADQLGARFISSLLAALAALAVGMIGVLLAYAWLGWAPLLSLAAGELAPDVCVLLLVGVFGETLADFWLRARRYRMLSDWKMLLENIEACYNEQLTHPLIANVQRFPLPISIDPSSIPAPRHPVTCSLPASIEPQSTEAQVWKLCNDAGWRLLLLADCGGGKSTVVYLLGDGLAKNARVALCAQTRAACDGAPLPDSSDLRFPVILDLSTWNAAQRVHDRSPHEKKSRARLSFHAWMIEEIVRTYHIKRRAAEMWLADGRLLPLLDALHALNSEQRQEIAEYLLASQNAPLIITCQTADYQAIKGAWRMPGRIVSLGPPDVFAVLASAAHPTNGAAALNRQARDHPDLLATLETPMLLSVALLATATGQPINAPSSQAGAVQDWEHALLEQYYAEQGLSGAQSNPRRGLAWLGRQLQRNGSHDARIDDVESSWAPSEEARKSYVSLVHVMALRVRLGLSLIFTLAAMQLVAETYEINCGVGNVFVHIPPVNLPLAHMACEKNSGVYIGVASLVIAGLLSFWGVAAGMAGALNAVRDFALLREPILTPLRLRQMALIALAVGLTMAFVATLGGASVFGFGGVAIIGFLGGLAPDIAWYVERWAHDVRQGSRRPNQPFVDSKAAALRTGALYTIIGVLAGGSAFAVGVVNILPKLVKTGVGVTNTVEVVLSGSLIGMAFLALLFGQVATLRRGGAAAIQHGFIRKTLVQSGVTPGDLLTFLGAMHSRKALCQQGDGFTFPIRSEVIRDFFADPEAPS